MRSLGRVLTLFIALILLAFPFIVWWKAQAIVDWWALRDYTPPARIAELAVDSSMTDYGRHIFYVNHPELISDVAEFRQNCSQSEQTIVLGCYHSNQNGIDIYDVKDPRLSGIHEVTAAHEMLHAAYDRLDSTEKEKINAKLQDYYNNHLTDERIQETLQTYEGLDSEELVNEMHSIFGTEAADLPAELEQHYKQYFVSRSTVTSLAENYDNEFESRIKAWEDYEERRVQLKNEIEVDNKNLEQQRDRIVAERRRLDQLRIEGRIDEYNSLVSSFNTLVDEFNNSVRRLEKKIDTYNKLVKEQNSVAQELRSLNEAIDSRTIPEPVQ